ncbi:MAG: AAA family ATPase [Candidatus Sumerlaeia bacterium]|nr:AAA family ATPase [Candidatus Sumerlaeia bacterium]
MIRSIRLKNFMSHADTTLELADGLTVLVGPNNCGKSAVVSALNLLSTLPGREGGYMVRHGQKSCRVEVTLSDGQTVAWARTNSPSVEINGESIPRIAQDQANALARVHEVLRLPQVVVEEGKYSFDIHFGQQKSPVFLLDQPASRAAVFFAASSDAQRLLEMQTVFKNKVTAKRRESNQITADMERLDGELARLAPLVNIAPHLDELQKDHDAIRRTHEDCMERERLLASLQADVQRAHSIRSRVNALADLKAPPVLDDDATLEALYTELKTGTAAGAHLQDQLTALAPLQSPPIPEDDVTLDRDLTTLERTVAARKELHQQVDVYKQLTDPPTLGDDVALDSLVEAISEAEKSSTTLGALISALGPLEPPPVLSDTDHAADLTEAIAGLLARRNALQNRHDAISDLNPPPAFNDPTPLEELLSDLEAAASIRHRIDKRSQLIGRLLEPPVPAETTSLEADIQALDELHRLHGERKRLLDLAREELRVWVENNPFCPTCGAELNPEEILAGGRGHGHS